MTTEKSGKQHQNQIHFSRQEEEGGRLSAKQQDGRAMATLDRQIPSLDTFLCEPWSSFVSAAKLRLVDSKFDRRGEEGGGGRPAVLTPVCRLFPDMLRRRHVPALEELCLVVCHVCSQVVTPQGILAHYGKAQRPAASWELAGIQEQLIRNAGGQMWESRWLETNFELLLKSEVS
uniref:Uncharacterized protein n=1 Tax=Takifugu rubripes TaxID=31033 RepID=A0A674NEE0_TAKRU